MAKKKTPPKKDSISEEIKKLPDYGNLKLHGDMMLSSTDVVINEINSTGTVIGGTIGSISNRVDRITDYIGAFNKEKNKANFLQNESKLELVQKELTSLKNETLPQLDEAKKMLEKLERYIRENATFLSEITSSTGRLQALESYVASLSKRLEFLEGHKQTRWTNSATVISIIVSIISISIAVYAVLKP